MRSLFEPEARDLVLQRIDQLAPDAKPQWGRFTAPQMVCHLTAAMRQALGELEADPPRGILSHAPVNWFVIHVLPWPKGKAKSPPEFLTTQPTSWNADVTVLRDLIERFNKRGPAGPWPASRVFGRISGESWGVLGYKHLDHHLRQFDV